MAGLVVWRRCYARGVGSWWKEDQRGGRADEGRHVYGIVQVFFAGAVAGRLDFEIGTWLHYRLLSEKKGVGSQFSLDWSMADLNIRCFFDAIYVKSKLLRFLKEALTNATL